MERFLVFATNHPVLIGIFIILLILLILTESRKGGKGVSCAELTHLVNREKAVVIDLRDSKAFKTGHIAGAINIPHDKLKKRASELNKHKSSPIILVCNQGQHSGNSGQLLHKAGFENVCRLKGGIQGWITDNLPLIKG